jgi:hypothetical protein
MKLTLGELADRMTILAAKLERLTDDKVLQDLAKQYQQCLDVLESLDFPDCSEEVAALNQVNNEGYDVVERIYADFRDEMYGTPCWSLFGDAKAQERAENTIKNCRRAHELNMERVRLKNAINAKAGAAQEVKSW